MKHKNQIERVIYDTARFCDYSEMRKMLALYGKNPDYLEIIIKANDDGKDFSGDSYHKTQAIRSFCISTDISGGVKREDESLKDLFKMVADIGARLEKIETTFANIGKRKTRGLNA